MPLTYLSLGTNLADRHRNLRRALTLIEQRVGTIVCLSDIVETEPWGFQSDNAFLNLCAAVSTTLQPTALLLATQTIERRMGRSSKSADGIYADRIIDIDILMYDNETVDLPQLHIPHPLMSQRLFVLRPLAQIAPHVRVPGTDSTVADLLEAASL